MFKGLAKPVESVNGQDERRSRIFPAGISVSRPRAGAMAG